MDVQADGSTVREFDGSGIGLTVTKQLVELMKGTICLDVTAGRFGSRLALIEYIGQEGQEENCASIGIE